MCQCRTAWTRMTEISTELVGHLVARHQRDGRCTYDPQAKAEVVRACVRPGVSVSRIAMQCGINANLLRCWIDARQLVGAARQTTASKKLNTSAASMGATGGDRSELRGAALRSHQTCIHRNRVKILARDRNGFWLLMKRFKQDRFIWPERAAVPTLTLEQLHWLL